MACIHSLLKFKFDDDFRQRLIDDRRDRKKVLSNEVTDSNGNAWKLELELTKRIPGSEEDGSSDDHFLGIFLRNVGGKNVCAKAVIILRDALGNIKKERSPTVSCTFEPQGGRKGSNKFIRISKVPDAGAIHVDVVLQIKPDETILHASINPFRANMMKILENGHGADVSFEVEGTIISAHTFILKMNSPILLNFCECHQQDIPVPIQDTTLDNFRIILRYVYGDNCYVCLTSREINAASENELRQYAAGS